MVVFLADRANIQIRQLHRRIRNRFRTDDRFEAVQFRVAEPREPGPYRVVANTVPQQFLENRSYPVDGARLEIGFHLPPESAHEYYWFNWVEPERDVLFGWHQDGDHPDLGQVHAQVTQDDRTVHRSATFIDEHPMAVVETRLAQLPVALEQIVWNDGDVVDVA